MNSRKRSRSYEGRSLRARQQKLVRGSKSRLSGQDANLLAYSGNMAILDWSVGPTYILKLLGCQFEQKPSIQALVRTVTGDFLVRLAEPSVCRPPCASQDVH